MPNQRQTKRRSKAKDEDTSQERDDKHRRFQASGPRPFWSGTISFGLVSLPVNLYPANRAKPVSLRMVDRDGTPLARRYFCEKEGRILENDELIRGYEVEKNEFVVVEDRELEEIAPEKSQEIDLKRFVGLDEIDPMYFQRAYFLTPDKGVTKAYRLLAKSMEESERAGIATFVMRGKEYLVAIIAEKGILRAETLRFSEEVRATEDIDLPDAKTPEKPRVKRFEKAIESLSTDTLDREALEDKYSQQIMARAHEKLAKGEDVIGIAEEDADDGNEAEQGGEVIDLMQVLKQSLAQGRPPQSDDVRADDTQQARKHNPRSPSSSPRTKKDKKSTEESPGSKRSPRKKNSTAKKSAAKKADSDQRRAPELEKLSKSELYDRAQELGIPGRSQMSKAQLIKAIEHAA